MESLLFLVLFEKFRTKEVYTSYLLY